MTNLHKTLTVALAALAIGDVAAENAAAQQPPQPPFIMQYEDHLTVRDDRTGTEVQTKRIKILAQSMIQGLSQQQTQYVEGMQTVETVEAYTEKSDGRRVPVDRDHILTSDAASGLQATYAPDLKVRTVIFPDVAVGDTLVLTNKIEILQGEFPGQFMDFDILPRSIPISSAVVTIEAPASLELNVQTLRDRANDKVEDIGAVRRHTITIAPAAYEPQEPGAVSPLDYEPAYIVSTFPSYEALGAAYGKAALPKAEPTPEISSLADEITKNVVGHRAQAEAIDAWVKKNIRYVALFLSTGRVVPHDAATILRNRYGDCKDKATLMTALLAAKGISSEQALINLGNVYTLPDPPTLAALNHVILYLPEFDLYDDPTANIAAFGVLALEAYNKPVVRVSAGGARVALTPPMNPKDHVAHAKTTIRIAADGVVTGQTEETNTGFFAMALRLAGAVMQQSGDEAVARRRLSEYNTPGTGHIEYADPSQTVDPVVVKGTFRLNGRFTPPAPGVVVGLPVGLPLTVRPGNFLLGVRSPGRESPFVCYAGTQVEDIEITFDAGLPLPVPFKETVVGDPYFGYWSYAKLEGRTLKIHRTMISLVPGQVCPAKAEAQISADLDRIRNNLYAGYRFDSLAPTAPQSATTPAAAALPPATAPALAAPRPATPPALAAPPPATTPELAAPPPATPPAVAAPPAAPPPATKPETQASKPTFEASRVAVADQPFRLDFEYSINPDCSPVGVPAVRVVEPPKSGTVAVGNGSGFTHFPADNLRFKCNGSRSVGAVVIYTPNPGFKGEDSITLEVIYPSGNETTRRYAIAVK